MTDRVERLTNLLALLLETPRPLTLVEIVGALEGQYPEGGNTLRQAFERDKKALREIGVPIETVELGGDRIGYRIDRPRYELDALHLEPDEMRALQLAFAAVRSQSGDVITAGEQALWKLGGARLDGSGSVTASMPELPGLPALRDAVARRAVVAFGYRGRERRVDPYSLMLRGGFWYLVGHDHGAGERRTYRVDRIDGEVEIDGADDAFQRPAGFDPRAIFPSEARHFGIVDDPAATARVRVEAPRAALVEREIGSSRVVARRKDGAIEVSVPAANVAALGSWVLGLGEHAKVLSPKPVREAIVARLKKLAQPPHRGQRSRR